MPITAAVGQKYLVTFNGSLDNQQIRTTFWYQLSAVAGAPNTSQVETSINALIQGGGGLAGLMDAATPGNYGLDSISVQCVEPTRVRGQTFLRGTNGAFNNCDAPGTAVCYTRAGDLAGRKHQSTVHIPCSTDGADIIQGFISAGVLAAVQALANGNLLSIVSAVPSFTASPIIRNGPGLADVTVLTRAFTSTTVRTMRRRVVGRGI